MISDYTLYRICFLSDLFRNCFLRWDHGNGDVPPTLDAALQCSSRAGSDLGLESGLVEELCQLGFLFPRRSCEIRRRDKAVLLMNYTAGLLL